MTMRRTPPPLTNSGPLRIASGYRNLETGDTIFALTTGSLPSAVAVVRLSGPRSFDLANRIFRDSGGNPLSGRGMYRGRLTDDAGNPLDDILCLAFKGPHSFTGEDVVEFQCHGSPPVIHRLSQALVALGARPARPGEFSWRAYAHDKLSAADLETLGDLFRARDFADVQRIYARRDGSLTRFAEALRDKLITLQAILDTAVDFSDEYSSVIHRVREPVEAAIRECSAVIHRYSRFRDASHVPRIVLAGRPNAGKSSLFNALIGRYRAIVHGEPGTTRDVVEEDVEIAGRRWKLVDTAGIRAEAEAAERDGLELGEAYREAAALWLLVVDGCQGLGEEERDLLERFGERPHLVVWNKRDLPGWRAPETEAIPVSAATGEGIGTLWGAIEHRGGESGGADNLPLPSLSQSRLLERVVAGLTELARDLDRDAPPEVLGERNRRIVAEVEGLIGEVGTEDVLDKLFGEFCIGK